MQRILLTFVDDIYEDLELWYPKLRLEESGFPTRMAAREIKTYSGKHGYPATADLLLKNARSKDFCGLLIPGGFMPDKLRRDLKVLSLTREFFEQGKLVAVLLPRNSNNAAVKVAEDLISKAGLTQAPSKGVPADGAHYIAAIVKAVAATNQQSAVAVIESLQR